MMQDVIVQKKAHGNIRRTQNGKSRGAVVAGCDFSVSYVALWFLHLGPCHIEKILGFFIIRKGNWFQCLCLGMVKINTLPAHCIFVHPWIWMFLLEKRPWLATQLNMLNDFPQPEKSPATNAFFVLMISIGIFQIFNFSFKFGKVNFGYIAVSGKWTDQQLLDDRIKYLAGLYVVTPKGFQKIMLGLGIDIFEWLCCNKVFCGNMIFCSMLFGRAQNRQV